MFHQAMYLYVVQAPADLHFYLLQTELEPGELHSGMETSAAASAPAGGAVETAAGTSSPDPQLPAGNVVSGNQKTDHYQFPMWFAYSSIEVSRHQCYTNTCCALVH